MQGYDFHGTWEPTTNQQSELFRPPSDPASPTFASTARSTAYLRRGAPPHKLVLGMPFYGRGWTGVGGGDNGLFQPATGAAPGTWEAGIEDYKVLKNLPGNGFVTPPGPAAGHAWLFDGTTFWTYDDPQVHGGQGLVHPAEPLGGVMFWALNGDTPDGELIARPLLADG